MIHRKKLLQKQLFSMQGLQWMQYIDNTTETDHADESNDFFCHPLDFFRIDDIIINEFTVLKSCRLSKMKEIRFKSGATAITVFDSKRRRKR